MAGNVSLWSTTALTNASADPDINFVEGQSPGSLNNSCRAVMAGVAGWRLDTDGTLTTGGTANAQTVTTNTPYAALATGIQLRFRAGTTNTGAATLTVTGASAFAAKALRFYTASGGDSALSAGMIRTNNWYTVRYDAAANSAAGAWMVMNPSSIVSAFRVRMNASRTNVTGNNTTYTINFDTEVFDRGGDFASGTTFTAPYTALYCFCGNVGISNLGTATVIRMQLAVTGKNFEVRYGAPVPDAGGFGAVNSFSVLHQMTAGDTAQLKVLVNGAGADTCHVYGEATNDYTYFCGWMVG